MGNVRVTAGPFTFEGRFQTELAPETCAAFERAMPFVSKAGQLSGNHFLTLTSGLENLAELGRLALWEGAQDIRFELA